MCTVDVAGQVLPTLLLRAFDYTGETAALCPARSEVGINLTDAAGSARFSVLTCWCGDWLLCVAVCIGNQHSTYFFCFFLRAECIVCSLRVGSGITVSHSLLISTDRTANNHELASEWVVK